MKGENQVSCRKRKWKAENGIRLRDVAWKYTILFAVCAFLCFLPFLFLKKSFVYQVDGRSQYVVYLRYMGEYLRENISRFLHGTFEPVMYDFSIGPGDDINAIVRFHPLDFLSVFCPGDLTEYLYDAILLIRYYLSGLCFCAFALTWKRIGDKEPGRLTDPVSTAGILAGAMVYVFCGYMLMRVMNHPTYAAPFIILPLMLLAAEKVMESASCKEGNRTRQKDMKGSMTGAVLFPIVIFLGFVSNYYFMYISSIGLLVYMLVRFPDYYRHTVRHNDSRGKVFLSLLIRMIGLYLVGTGMSMAVFLPTMIRYANSARTTQTAIRQNLLVYSDPRRYFAWMVNLITPFASSGNGTNLNYAVIVLPALFSLFCFRRRKYRTLKCFLGIELACLLIPAAGYVMAGFQNENNRWIYLISLALGMTVAFMADSFFHLSVTNARILASGAAAFTALSAAAAVFTKRGIFAFAAVLEMLTCTVILITAGRRSCSRKAVRMIVLAVTSTSVVLNAWITWLPGFGNMAARCTNAGKAFRRFEKGPGKTVGKLDEDGFYRIDVSALKAGTENSGIYSGYHGISIYNSILNAGMMESMVQTDNVGLDSLTHLQDLDGRFPTESLAGVKYYLTKREGDRPYGFSEEPVLKSKRYYVYQNEMALPFAYSYDSVIWVQDQAQMDSASKELIKVHAAVIDPADVPGAEHMNRITSLPEDLLIKELDLPASAQGMERTEDGYTTGEKKGVLTLPCETIPGYHCLLLLKGLGAQEESRKIKITSGSLRKVFVLRGAQDTYTLGREDYIVDLMDGLGAGSAGEENEISVTFRKNGHYHLDSASIVYIPVEGMSQEIEKLSQDAMADPEISPNRVSGTIHMSREKVVTFQVLFQKGWNLYVDGEKVPLFCSNNCYLGALIPEGSHDILLKYTTPGLGTGMAISLISFLAWILIIAVSFRTLKKPRHQA